ncbi:MAG: penicillin acylase family protein, partial [Myxococcales bacterium]|nr:penicillin acylase family protein [Myxococcales bacterium]
GFVTARDRYFMMDLSRRLGQGRISELLGDAALDIDQESRGTGIAYVAQQIMQSMSTDVGDYADAFAAGINEYITRVQNDELPPPSELVLAQGILGASSPTDLMQPFDRIDIAAMAAVILYNSSYETGDVGRAAAAAALPTSFAGATQEELRRQGAIVDIWQDIAPVQTVSSVGGLVETSAHKLPAMASVPGAKLAAKVPASVYARAIDRFERQQKRLNRDKESGYGSNAWAVAGSASSDGAGLLAGDGHLSLSVPSILYRLGLDTELFGGGDLHQLGATIPGFPVVAIGTNGKVAWSQTQLAGDITDWYVEEIQLGQNGVPAATLFQGEWHDLVRVEEEYDIADVPLLGSVGRRETWMRFVTFDGRWIADIEGRDATADEVLAPGEVLVNFSGSYVVPGDIDGDGVISAISFDYAGFDAGFVLAGADAIGRADDVDGFVEAARRLVGYSQNFAVADRDGNALYGAFQAFPCRGYLTRNPDGSWAEGADPNLLLDGTRFGGFTIPLTADGVVDDGAASDPYACAVPHADLPQVKNPARGYVVTANNDLTGTTFDGSLTDDPWYFGGPWNNGFRAHTIETELKQAVAEGRADMATMSEIQGNTASSLGALFTDAMLASLDYAAALSAPTDPADQRIATLYQAEASAIDEVKARLAAWRDGGYRTPSGVATFYDEVAAGDAEDSVATTLFNAWLPRVISGTFDDEGLPGIFQPGGSHGRIRALRKFLAGRGSGNPSGLASYDSATGESVFFDRLDTAEVETSHEVIVTALVDALTFLRSAPTEEDPFEGGYGTSDMSAYVWGLRHYAKLESLLADFIGNDPQYAPLTERFAVSTLQCPLEEGGVSPGDPLFGLSWFPRDGDNYSVDAANPGFGGTRFSYGSGPVMRMVISLHGDEVKGVNIIPGGQSALTDSEYFADQAHLWLGNETSPMRYSVDDVVAGAIGRETYLP